MTLIHSLLFVPFQSLITSHFGLKIKNFNTGNFNLIILLNTLSCTFISNYLMVSLSHPTGEQVPRPEGNTSTLYDILDSTLRISFLYLSFPHYFSQSKSIALICRGVCISLRILSSLELFIPLNIYLQKLK